MDKPVLPHRSRKQKGGQGSGYSSLRESSVWAEALGVLEPAHERLSTRCPEWGYKSKTHTDGPASEGEDKSTPSLQGTEAGLGLSADMLTGSGNGLEKRLNIFLKGGTL